MIFVFMRLPNDPDRAAIRIKPERRGGAEKESGSAQRYIPPIVSAAIAASLCHLDDTIAGCFPNHRALRFQYRNTGRPAGPNEATRGGSDRGGVVLGRRAAQSRAGGCREGRRPSFPSLRGANGSRGCAPDDRLRDEAIQSCCGSMDCFASLAMTIGRGRSPVSAGNCGHGSLLSQGRR